jgi:environmental stress-induced protein Ves
VCEIYRFPEAATDESYMVRFSTATIEVPELGFTLYPGYILHHRTLKGLCVFNINGSENTTCIDQRGTVFDFFGGSLQSVRQGDALIANNQGLCSVGPIWHVSNSAVKIYHGIVDIPEQH